METPRQIDILLPEGKKVFFASDFHLGAPDYESSRERERRIVQWIAENRNRMGALFLLGDVFDYWFEYRYVIPKGYVRLLSKIAELSDSNIPVYFFCGNHDSWTRDFFPRELGVQVLRDTSLVTVNGFRFLVGHGDGLGSKQGGYKLMKKIFNAKSARAFYASLHPYWAHRFACSFSRHSRKSGTADRNEEIAKKRNRSLHAFMREYLKENKVDAFIFAHLHAPLLAEITENGFVSVPENRIDLGAKKNACYLNTGDWLNYDSYAVFDGRSLSILSPAQK